MESKIVQYYFSTATILLCLFEFSSSIKIVSLYVPPYVLVDKVAVLRCSWTLNPKELLYSVKWYKDSNEFFRHMPRSSMPFSSYEVPGVTIQSHENDDLSSNLTLASVSLDASEQYRCEVSGEKPNFITDAMDKEMFILAVPDRGPILQGFMSHYRVGDVMKVSCSSGKSYPATQLAWYLNGEPVHPVSEPHYINHTNNLISTVWDLEIELVDEDFKGGALKLKCIAILDPVYWRSTEEIASESVAEIMERVTFPITRPEIFAPDRRGGVKDMHSELVGNDLRSDIRNDVLNDLRQDRERAMRDDSNPAQWPDYKSLLLPLLQCMFVYGP